MQIWLVTVAVVCCCGFVFARFVFASASLQMQTSLKTSTFGSTGLHCKHPSADDVLVVQSIEASYHVALGPLATGAVLGACWPLPSYAGLTTPLVQRITAFLDLLPRRAPSACLGRR